MRCFCEEKMNQRPSLRRIIEEERRSASFERITAIGLGTIIGVTILASPSARKEISNNAKQVATAPVHALDWLTDSIMYGKDKYRKEQHTGNGYETFLDVAYRDPQLASFTRYVNDLPEGTIVVPSDKTIYVFVRDENGRTIHEWADEFGASKASGK